MELKQRNKKLIIKIIVALAAAFAIVLLVPAVQSVIITLAEKIIGRQLRDWGKWHRRLTIYGTALLFLDAIVLLFYLDAIFCSGKYRFFLYKQTQNEKFQQIILYVVCFFIVIFSCVTVLKHEPWRDELQVWLIDRDLSLGGVFHEMRYEGHFMLWNLILYPFAHFGAPIIFLNLVSWAINSVTVFYFAKKAPFNFITKIFILLTHPFLYINPVISRCYVLIPILLFLLATIYEQKDKRAITYGFLVALLANTHLFMEGIVAFLGVDFLISSVICKWKSMSQAEKRQKIVALCVGLLGIFFAAAQVIPAFGNASSARNSVLNYNFINNKNFSGIVYFFTTAGFNTVIKAIILIWLLFFLLCAMYTKLQSFLCFVISIFYMIMFACCVYGASVVNRGILWFYVLIFCSWISFHQVKLFDFDKTKSKKIFNFLLCAVAFFMISIDRNIGDFKNEYDSTRRTALAINEILEKDTPIFVEDNHQNTSITVYLNIEDHPVYDFKSLEKLTRHTFKRRDYENLSNGEFLVRAINSDIVRGDDVYFFRYFNSDEDFDEFDKTLENLRCSVIFKSGGYPNFYLMEVSK